MRNVLALQQAIRTIANETLPKDFERVKHYYSLFFMSPQVRHTLFWSLHYDVNDHLTYRRCWRVYGESRHSLSTNTRRY
jgi:hypothetical protein